MANTSTNVWDQMVLFNQLTLQNILNRHEDLGTAELRAAVAALTNEQRDDTVCFLMHETEELAGLPNGQGIQAIANVYILLDYLPANEPNTGGGPYNRVTHKSLGGVVSYMLPKFEVFLGQMNNGFYFIK